jgi:hypothetical protein
MMAANHTTSVIAGLDPAIHFLAKKMDSRVEPAGADFRGESSR